MKNREPKTYIDNKLKTPKAFFDWCYSQIYTYKWSNKQQTINASDRENCYVVEKRLTKRTNLTFFDRFYSFTIVLVTTKRIEVQQYGFWSRINQGKQNIDFDLTNFEQYANNQHIKVTGDTHKYFYGLTPNFFGGGPYSGTKFYSNSWEKKVMTVSELQYLNFSDCHINDLDNIYKYRNEIEFLQKINAKTLANEIMYPSYKYSNWKTRKSVDMRTINANWLKKNKPFFKNSNRSFNEYELEKRIKLRNGKVVPGIEDYLDYRDINKVPRGVGMIRFQNWIIKNEVDFSYYLDYLSLLKDLNITLDSENLIIPKDLTKAHDNAVSLLNQMKREVNEKQYDKRLKSILKYETLIGNYAFLVPKNLNELIVEGKSLHHCVGGSNYVDMHKNGKTTIVFLRKKNSINESFYTLEFNNKRIIQIRGKHNKDAPPEVQEAANKWMQLVNKNKTAELSKTKETTK